MNMKRADQHIVPVSPGLCLVVDLSSETCQVQEIDSQVMEQYRGGRGLSLWLWKEYCDEQALEPSSYESGNPVVITVGPFVGTNIACSNLFCITTRSVATGRMTVAKSSTGFGTALKHAGYDAMVILGRSRRPLAMLLEDHNVAFLNSERFMGVVTSRITELFGRKPGDCILSIGPAGEAHVPFASVVCEGKSIGRGGIGAVFGYKNLKAIIVDGTLEAPEVELSAQVAAIKSKLTNSCEKSPFAQRLRKQGTLALVQAANEGGWAPVENYRLRTDPRLFYLGGKEHERRYGMYPVPCGACPLSCQHTIGTGHDSDDICALQYETAMMLGANLGIYDPDKVLKLDQACVDDGVDPVSMGNILGWAMRARKEGVLPMLPDLEHGGIEAFVRVIDAVSYKKGAGEVLGLGVKALCERFGGMDWGYQIDGLEMGPYDVRGCAGQGACQAVGSDIQFVPQVVLPRLAKAKPKVLAAWIAFHENLSYALESLGICSMLSVPTLYEGYCSNPLLRNRTLAKWLMRTMRHPEMLVRPSIFAALIREAYGVKFSSSQFLALGREAWQLQLDLDRMLGKDRQGMGVLPEYFQIDPDSNAKHEQIVKLRPLVAAYWKQRSPVRL